MGEKLYWLQEKLKAAGSDNGLDALSTKEDRRSTKEKLASHRCLLQEAFDRGCAAFSGAATANYEHHALAGSATTDTPIVTSSDMAELTRLRTLLHAPEEQAALAAETVQKTRVLVATTVDRNPFGIGGARMV